MEINLNMPETEWMPLQSKDFDAAKRQYLELYGSLAVMKPISNRGALPVFGCTRSCHAQRENLQRFHNLRPLVIRIN